MRVFALATAFLVLVGLWCVTTVPYHGELSIASLDRTIMQDHPPDAGIYLRMADRFLRTGGFFPDGEPVPPAEVRVPLYAIFVAMVWSVQHARPIWIPLLMVTLFLLLAFHLLALLGVGVEDEAPLGVEEIQTRAAMNKACWAVVFFGFVNIYILYVFLVER